jgi:hypothetical protein
LIGSVGANGNFFDDTTARSGNSYSYRIAAYNSAGTSAFSSATANVRPNVARATGLVSISSNSSTNAAPHTNGLPLAYSSFAGAVPQILEAIASAGAARIAFSAAQTAGGAADALWIAVGADGGQELFGLK